MKQHIEVDTQICDHAIDPENDGKVIVSLNGTSRTTVHSNLRLINLKMETVKEFTSTRHSERILSENVRLFRVVPKQWQNVELIFDEVDRYYLISAEWDITIKKMKKCLDRSNLNTGNSHVLKTESISSLNIPKLNKNGCRCQKCKIVLANHLLENNTKLFQYCSSCKFAYCNICAGISEIVTGASSTEQTATVVVSSSSTPELEQHVVHDVDKALKIQDRDEIASGEVQVDDGMITIEIVRVGNTDNNDEVETDDDMILIDDDESDDDNEKVNRREFEPDGNNLGNESDDDDDDDADHQVIQIDDDASESE